MLKTMIKVGRQFRKESGKKFFSVNRSVHPIFFHTITSVIECVPVIHTVKYKMNLEIKRKGCKNIQE